MKMEEVRRQRLNDTLAYALMAWPVPLISALLPDGFWGGLGLAVGGSWLVLVVAHARQRYVDAPRFAMALLAGTVCVALAVWFHPSPLTWFWVILALLFQHTGQRTLLFPDAPDAPEGTEGTEGTETSATADDGEAGNTVVH